MPEHDSPISDLSYIAAISFFMYVLTFQLNGNIKDIVLGDKNTKFTSWVHRLKDCRMATGIIRIKENLECKVLSGQVHLDCMNKVMLKPFHKLIHHIDNIQYWYILMVYCILMIYCILIVYNCDKLMKKTHKT